jgi:hypothetical protein
MVSRRFPDVGESCTWAGALCVRRPDGEVEAGQQIGVELAPTPKKRRVKSTPGVLTKKLSEQRVKAAQQEHDRMRGVVMACTDDEGVRERAFVVFRLLHEMGVTRAAAVSDEVKRWIPEISETNAASGRGRGVNLRWRWIGTYGHGHGLISLIIEPNVSDRLEIEGSIEKKVDLMELESFMGASRPQDVPHSAWKIFSDFKSKLGKFEK